MTLSQEQHKSERADFKSYLRECDEYCIVPDVGGAFHAGYEAARASMLRPIPEVEGWISFDDQMPEVIYHDGQVNSVLVFHKPGTLADNLINPNVANVAWIIKNKQYLSHWMPLPSPPSNEEPDHANQA